MKESLNLAVSETNRSLARKAYQIRQQVIQMVYDGGSGHCGGSLSVADILAVLYFHVLKIRPEEPLWPQRDRFVLSKGHACPALYAVLADRGFFSESLLKDFRHINSILHGHPEYGIPGVETVSGSLGQGFSTALGMAVGLRLKGIDSKVYAIIGDGESQEGLVWECAMAAGHFKLDNFICFLDRNRLQGDGTTEEIMEIEPLADKWRAFNWEVTEIDGNDVDQILKAIDWAKKTTQKPKMIIAHTVKGKGVSFMENVVAWHGTAPPTDKELSTALGELKSIEEGL